MEHDPYEYLDIDEKKEKKYARKTGRESEHKRPDPFIPHIESAHKEILQFFNNRNKKTKDGDVTQTKAAHGSEKRKSIKTVQSKTPPRSKLKKAGKNLNPDVDDQVLLEEFRKSWCDDSECEEVTEEFQRLLDVKDDRPLVQLEQNSEVFNQYMKLWSPFGATGTKAYYNTDYGGSSYENSSVKPTFSGYEDLSVSKHYGLSDATAKSTKNDFDNIRSSKSYTYENVSPANHLSRSSVEAKNLSNEKPSVYKNK